MSDKSVTEKLFDEAKLALGRLGFDVSVDKKTCIRQVQRLVREGGEMISALDPTGDICEQIIKEIRERR